MIQSVHAARGHTRRDDERPGAVRRHRAVRWQRPVALGNRGQNGTESPAAWIVRDGYFEAQGGNLSTRESFGDVQMHLEYAIRQTAQGFMVRRTASLASTTCGIISVAADSERGIPRLIGYRLQGRFRRKPWGAHLDQLPKLPQHLRAPVVSVKNDVHHKERREPA